MPSLERKLLCRTVTNLIFVFTEFVPKAVAAGTSVCNQHCRTFHQKQLKQKIQEKLRPFREEKFKVQFDVDFFSSSCISDLLKHMKREKYGWHGADELSLVPYLNPNWHEQRLNEKDYNRMVPGTFKVKPRKWGQLMTLRVKFSREKCVRTEPTVW